MFKIIFVAKRQPSNFDDKLSKTYVGHRDPVQSLSIGQQYMVTLEQIITNGVIVAKIKFVVCQCWD